MATDNDYLTAIESKEGLRMVGDEVSVREENKKAVSSVNACARR
jgi:hypothetical protein